LAIEMAEKRGKPCLHVDLRIVSQQECVAALVKWIREDCPADCVLNVAGSRESKAEGIQDLVQAIMVDVLRETNPECRKFYPLSL